MKLKPNQPLALYWKGKLVFDKSDYSVAKGILIESNNLENNPETLYLLGECYLHLSDEAKAIECFE